MRFINLLVAMTLTGLVLSANAAYSENFDAVKLHDLDNSLKHRSGNIITIKQELITQTPTIEQSTKEGEYSDSVLSILSEISIESENIIENQSQSGETESEHGKSAVQERENDRVSSFKGKCGYYLDEINLNLNKIKNAALHFEVKNARDDIVKICDILQPGK